MKFIKIVDSSRTFSICNSYRLLNSLEYLTLILIPYSFHFNNSSWVLAVAKSEALHVHHRDWKTVSLLQLLKALNFQLLHSHRIEVPMHRSVIRNIMRLYQPMPRYLETSHTRDKATMATTLPSLTPPTASPLTINSLIYVVDGPAPKSSPPNHRDEPPARCSHHGSLIET